MSAREEISRLRKDCADLAADIERQRQRAREDQIEARLNRYEFVDRDARNAVAAVVFDRIARGASPEAVIAEAVVKYAALIKPPAQLKPDAAEAKPEPQLTVDIKPGMSETEQRRALEELQRAAISLRMPGWSTASLAAPSEAEQPMDSAGLLLESIKPGMSLEEQKRAAGELLKHVKR